MARYYFALLWFALLPVTAGAQPCMTWSFEPTLDQSGIAFAASAFDSRRGVGVLFGGERQGSPVPSFFWEWHDETWISRGGPTPPARHSSACAYDARRDLMVLYGGISDNPLGDTWEYDGFAWREIAVQGPAPRFAHAMAFDVNRGVTVLFGGLDGDERRSRETWEYDGVTWTLRATGGPAARFYHTLTYDPHRGVTVLFGGTTNALTNDVWEWDGEAWTRRTTEFSPQPRSRHAAAYDEESRSVVICGGFNGTMARDTWLWDGERWALGNDHAGEGRMGASMFPAGNNGGLVLVGGQNPAQTFADMHVFRGGKWRGQFESPVPRTNAAMAYDSKRDAIVLHNAGWATSTERDTWEFDGFAWTRHGNAGPRRDECAMVYDEARELTVLYGGFRDNNIYFTETWGWNGIGWTMLSDEGPGPRRRHSMVYDSHREVIVFFGGQHRTTAFGDTWEWDGRSWTQRNIAGPSPRRSFAMAYDKARRETILFGGANGLNDTWKYDGDSWTQLHPTTNPASVVLPEMAYDDHRGVIVLHGGTINSSAQVETWEWNGQDWRRTTAFGPQTSEEPSMAYDSLRRRMVFYGGRMAGGSDTRTWFYGDHFRVLAPPRDLHAFIGNPAEFRLLAAAPPGTTFRWHKDGVPLDDGPRIAGAFLPVLTIDPVISSDAGEYFARIENECSSTDTTAAVLTVTCYPDCDPSTGKGVLDIFDFLCFANRFDARDAYACDCDTSSGLGVCDLFDFLCFGNAFAAGCP